MELTGTERQLFELLREKDDQAARDSQQRNMRFLVGVSERTGIPMDALGINPATFEVVDRRMMATPTADDDESVTADEGESVDE